jgi:hypothetical protein
MIDFIILEQMTAFAVIMQKHPGWVGFIQKTILESVGCIWFNRNDLKDREVVAKKYNFSFPMHYLLYIVQFIKRTLSTGYEIMFNIQTAILS